MMVDPVFTQTTTCPPRTQFVVGEPQNRDITLRTAENKEQGKLHDENYGHVYTFVQVLKAVQSEFPGIYFEPDRLWNMDETSVSTEFGEKEKVFGASDTHHGGFRSISSNRSNKHITAVVAVFASGRKTPPFFIMTGKNLMSSWFQPLTKDEFPSRESKELQWLTRDSWIPDDAFVLTYENGSMEKRLFKFCGGAHRTICLQVGTTEQAVLSDIGWPFVEKGIGVVGVQ